MNDVVERVARAVSAAMGESWREPPYNNLHTDSLNNGARFIARAAIIETLKSLREPSPQMLAAVDDEASDKFVARGRAYSAWVSMIDAALADASPDIGKEGIGNDVR